MAPPPASRVRQVSASAEVEEDEDHDRAWRGHSQAFAHGQAVRRAHAAYPGGWCDPKRRQIVVASGPANRQVRTLVHELTHALEIGYRQYGREQAEVLVDCVTYIVCSSVGLDVGGESIPYIAS